MNKIINMTIKKYIEQFLHYLEVERGFSPRTIKAYDYDLIKFTDFLIENKKETIESIKKVDIRSFLSDLAKNNAEITRARKLSTIKSFFKYLSREGILEINPASDIETPKIPEKEPCYLTQEEYQKLLSVIQIEAKPYYNLRDLAIVTLFLGTGVRLSELVGMNLNSVNLDERSIKVRGKGNKERTIPLNSNVMVALEKYLKSRPNVNLDSLFISRLGNRLSTGGIYHLIKGYLKRAGINKEKVGVHSLRHTFGASLLNKNVNLVVIQELLGHKRLETTRRYLHINNLDLRNAVDQIAFK
ncbi:MAG: site-specific tyrosine recombinase/integron integrase [Candidatus Paceibacterota bacterium]